MTYIVKNKNNWLDFDSFVDSDTLQIIVTCEPVGSPLSATEFFSESSAKLAIDGYERTGGDVNEFTIHDKEQVLKEMQEEAERKATELIKETWQNTSEEKKKEMLAKILEKDGTEGVAKWLEQMGETNIAATSSTNEQIEVVALDPTVCIENNSPEEFGFGLSGPMEFDFTFNGVTQTMVITQAVEREDDPDLIKLTVETKEDDTGEEWINFFPKALKDPEPRDYVLYTETTYDDCINKLVEEAVNCIKKHTSSFPAYKDFGVEINFIDADILQVLLEK